MKDVPLTASTRFAGAAMYTPTRPESEYDALNPTAAAFTSLSPSAVVNLEFGASPWQTRDGVPNAR